MMLLFLLLLLVVPYLLLTLVDRWGSFKIRPSTRARVGLSLFFIFTSIGHFVKAEEMSAMLPPLVPYRIEVVYLTGVLELWEPGVWIAPKEVDRVLSHTHAICFCPPISILHLTTWISAVMGKVRPIYSSGFRFSSS
jgi:hypothetical protein